MRIAQALFSQGFGTRRECNALLRAGRVAVGAEVIEAADTEVDPQTLVLQVDGQPWPYHERALVMLHKPPGYECSQRPSAWPSVLALLPPQLGRRGVQPVGRLDADSTGLLLLSDDGTLIHRLTSPKQHLPKVYEVGCKHEVDDAQAARLRAGVLLHDTPAPVRAAACEITGMRALRLTITEGRYHQVKRMVAAAGNRVETLHRSGFGTLRLPADLVPGQWRWISAEQGAALLA